MRGIEGGRVSRLVLVTGASGFVGRHLVGRLVRDGARVRALSRNAVPAEGCEFVPIADYGDAAALRHALAGVEVVFHLAGRAHRIHENLALDEAERALHDANVVATVALALAARDARVRRFVFASSIGVNGPSATKPMKSTDVPRPAEPYARSKLVAEREIARLLAGTDTEYVNLRIPLVYGPGAPGNFGELQRLVARLPLVPLGAVSAARSLIAIDNLVDAMCVAADHPVAANRTFLVADRRDTTVAEIARQLAAGMGRPPWVVIPIPPAILAALAAIAGRRDTWEKLAAPLRVDASDFREATGWVAPVDTGDALKAAGARPKSVYHRPNR